MNRISPLLMIIAMLISSSTCCALTLTTEDAPPFNIVDPQTKEVTGISFDKVTELMRRAHEAYTITPYPWARAYQMALESEDTCVFSTTRTPEREPLFQWIGPLAKNDWMIFARANDTRKPKSLEELRPFVLGGYQGDATADFLMLQGFKVDLARSDAENPQKLLHERFDFWASNRLVAPYMIKKSGVAGKIIPLFGYKQVELYLACRLSIDSQRVKRFNRILGEMEQDGTSAAIENRYR